MGFSSISGDETIVSADNASFNGTARGGKMTADGQLWMGSSIAPHVGVGTITAGSGISVTNGHNSITIAATGAGSITQINGDSGSATPSAGVITFDATTNAGATISFSGSGSTVNLNVSNINGNTILGNQAGNNTQTGLSNTGFGAGVLAALTSGGSNTAVGISAGSVLKSGGRNTLIGTEAGILLDNNAEPANDNTLIGTIAGQNYVGSESANILIGSQVVGTASESHVIRIGNQGSGIAQQNQCFIAGIEGVSVSNKNIVTINTSTGQMGSDASVAVAQGGTGATSFTQTNGVVTYNGTSLVNYAGPQISSSGVFTNTTQPAFAAYLNTTVTNKTGTGTVYTIIFDNKIFDNDTNFTLASSTFTAPVTGNYFLQVSAVITNITTANATQARIITTGGAYYNQLRQTATSNNQGNNLAVVVPMTAGDTATFAVSSSGESADTDGILGSGGGIRPTVCSGFLQC